MLKKTGILFSLLTGFVVSFCNPAKDMPQVEPITHEQWDSLLKRYVSADGLVNYTGFVKDSIALQSYLQLLSNNPPQKSWSDEERLAYWINAYNAFTVKLIVDHYPVKSIKDIKKGIPFINSVWDIKFFKIGKQSYDLNKIEHGIIRKKFQEPRIHFAINCASISCPALASEAYASDRLDMQLERAARSFINDPLRNKISVGAVSISKIFSWFSGDFKKKAPNVIDFINRYAEVPISEGVDIDYLDYNWQLNEADL
ncbi:MAG: DUF547 domain-containing protein [Saprospiraceae bacterium]|nr:DUF547 domain-containing protein [Saprospiraceae bacterium]